MPVSFLTKLEAPVTLFKKENVNFAKFLRTPFVQNIFERLLLNKVHMLLSDLFAFIYLVNKLTEGFCFLSRYSPKKRHKIS